MSQESIITILLFVISTAISIFIYLRSKDRPRAYVTEFSLYPNRVEIYAGKNFPPNLSPKVKPLIGDSYNHSNKIIDLKSLNNITILSHRRKDNKLKDYMFINLCHSNLSESELDDVVLIFDVFNIGFTFSKNNVNELYLEDGYCVTKSRKRIDIKIKEPLRFDVNGESFIEIPVAYAFFISETTPINIAKLIDVINSGRKKKVDFLITSEADKYMGLSETVYLLKCKTDNFKIYSSLYIEIKKDKKIAPKRIKGRLFFIKSKMKLSFILFFSKHF
ncbi:MAG: hypothetical protein FWE14_08070 [Lachnospiraceae bacterium]|nr:hypothetical protein [Lachnospiraceae bacterium]